MKDPSSRPRAFLFSALLLVLCSSCSSGIHKIKSRPLIEKNPTSYEFPGRLPEIRQTIIEALNIPNRSSVTEEFYSSFSEESFYFRLETEDDTSFGKKIFQDAANANDLYLHSWGEPISFSPVYFGGGRPLKYRATFQLHLTAISDNRTKVSVIVHNPTVINGSKCCGLHGYVSNDVPVEPTTIEEYKILQFIGRLLDIHNMPPLRLPEDK